MKCSSHVLRMRLYSQSLDHFILQLTVCRLFPICEIETEAHHSKNNGAKFQNLIMVDIGRASAVDGINV